MSNAEPDLETRLRLAMRQVAATVFVVTTGSLEARIGLTATAVTSLSLDPPSLLICLNRSSQLHQALRPGAPFCVNLLGAGQAEIGRRFGGGTPQSARFADDGWYQLDGAPALIGTLAGLTCRLGQQIDHGTHCICIGQVTAVALGGEADPLLWRGGGFARLAA